MKAISIKCLNEWIPFVFAASILPTLAPASPPHDHPRLVEMHDLIASCGLTPSAPCDITISLPIETIVTEHARLPRESRIHFVNGASWTLDGATIDFAGASIEAAPGSPVLKGSSRIVGLATARPEWFAAPSEDGVYPAEALGAAYRAIQTGGKIFLASHTYLSPFFDPESPGSCGGKTILIDSSLTMVGTRRPVPDVDRAPTRLLDGTVIRGELCGTGVLRASHLGVDVGPFVVERHFRGRQTYGVQLGSTGVLGQAQGSMLEDISVLTTGLKDQHSVIIEGQRDAILRGLWIWTLGGTHGLVVKSSSSIVEDFHCRGASADCLILKSDYATDHAGDASGSRVDGVFISFLAVPGDTAGIMLDGSWDSLRNLQLTHIVEHGLRYGIIGFDSILHQIAGVRLTDWSATGMNGPCLVLYGSRRVSVERFFCSGDGLPPGPALLLRGRETSLLRGTIACEGAAHCNNPRNDGVLDLGRDDTIESVEGKNLGGYLVRISPHRGGTTLHLLDAKAMAGRAFAPPQISAFSFKRRIAEWQALAKQTLRIIYTAATTKATSLSAKTRIRLELFVAVLSAIALLTFLRRKRPSN